MDYTVHGILQGRILEWVAYLQQIFMTQESNQGLQHCRQILYQLSYLESPTVIPHFAIYAATAAAKLLQSCPTLCNPIDGSPHQAPPPRGFSRTLEWVAISFSNA